MMPTTVHTYTGDGVLTDFTISFSFLDESYVTFKVEDTALADVTSNYTGSMFDANTFRFTVPIPSGFRVTFTRDTQLTDDLFSFATGAVIRPNDLGDSMKTLRDYTEEKHDQTANVNINIASDAVTSATSIATTKASEASASATAAAGSASAASTSASNAATSETNAGTSETNAAASATAAATSETNSATSETNAATSASNASTSETNAAASATAAATSATNAGTSETNAAASETAAEAARDVVKDVILGQFANDAAVDTYLSGVSYTKDTGDLYFNTTDSRMKVYTGSAWVDVANTTSSDAAATSATAAQTAQTAAEAALNTFVSSYLGSYSSDSAVNTAKASVLTAGDIYFNTTDTILKYYNGSSWHPAAAAQVLNTSNLGNVGDVDYSTAPQSGDYLRRNASNQWERRAVADVKSDLNLPTDAAADISANAATIATAVQPNTTPELTGLTIDNGSGGANAKIGYTRNADGNAFIDLVSVGSSTTDGQENYGARFIRASGADSNTTFTHRGTGELQFKTEAAAALRFQTNNQNAMILHSNQKVQMPDYGVNGNTGAAAYSLAVDANGYIIEEQDVSSTATPSFGTLTATRGTYPAVNVQETGQAGQGQLAQSGPEVQLRNTGNGGLSFFTNNTTRVRIGATGLVGIGTNSPDTLVEMVGADPVLTIRDSETGIANSSATLRLAETGAGDTLDEYWDTQLYQGSYRVTYSGNSRLTIDRTSGEVQTLNGTNMVSVRKADVRTTTGTHTLVGGASLYYANAAATYDTASLTPGDIVTIYNEGGGTVTVNTGGTVSLYKDGEASPVSSAVTIGADTIATVTCVSATKAIISGSDVT